MPPSGLDDAQEKLVRYISGHGVGRTCGWVGEKPPVWQVVCDVGRQSNYHATWQLECEHGIRGCKYGGYFQHGSVSGWLGSRWNEHVEHEPERLPDCATCRRNAAKWCDKEERNTKRQNRKAARDAKRQNASRNGSHRGLPVSVQWVFGVASLLGLVVACYLWWSA